MPDSSVLLIFVGAATIILFPPGPAVLYLIAKSIDQGPRAGIISVVGIALGSSTHVIAAAFGLSALLLSSEPAYNIVRLLGAGYLIYLGVQKILARNAGKEQDKPQERKSNNILIESTMVGILNPKAALFFLAFATQFINTTSGSAVMQINILGLIWILMGAVVGIIYSLLAASLRSWLPAKEKILRSSRFISGGIYIVLGIAAAISGPSRR